MLVQEEISFYLAIELSLKKISYVLYARARSCARADDAKFVRSRNAQCKTRESPSCAKQVKQAS